MHRILIVAATDFEVAPFQQYSKKYKNTNIIIDFLITGIGAVATTFALTQKLSSSDYDFVLNTGIAGSYIDELPIGTVAFASEDQFADLAFEEVSGYQTFFESGFIAYNHFPFKEGKLWPVKELPKWFSAASSTLPKGKAITVNKVHGQKRSIALAVEKFSPEIESMEGAAVFYVCNQLNTACAQLRSISNKVEVRNRKNWDIPRAIKTLNNTLIELLY